MRLTWLRNGVDLAFVQKALGHANISSTVRYPQSINPPRALHLQQLLFAFGIQGRANFAAVDIATAQILHDPISVRVIASPISRPCLAVTLDFKDAKTIARQ